MSKGPYPRTLYQGSALMNACRHQLQRICGVKQCGWSYRSLLGQCGHRGAGSAPWTNNVPEALFLLLRTEDITAAVFTCPSSNATADVFGGGTNTALNQISFTNIQNNLSYSYANPYPDTYSLGSGYKMVQGLEPTFAVAADINPGTTGNGGNDNVMSPNTSSSGQAMTVANSNNHGKQGQNILFGDGHVEFDNNCFSGTDRDNIYTRGGPTWGTAAQDLVASPYTANDSVLLPTDDNL